MEIQTRQKIESLITMRRASLKFLADVIQLHGLPKLSLSKLYYGLAGQQLNREAEARLNVLLDEILDLAIAAEPMPLRLDDAVAIKKLLDERRQKTLRPWWAVMIDSQYFRQVLNFAMVQRTSNLDDAAAFSTEAAANAAVAILTALEEPRVRAVKMTGQYRRPNTIYENLSEFGFKQEDKHGSN